MVSETHSVSSVSPDSGDSIALPVRGWCNVCLLGGAHFVSDFYCNVLPVLLPVLAARFNLSYSQCGVIFMVFSVSMNLIQPPIGLLTDRFRLNILMPVSIMAGAVFSCLLGVSPGIVTVMLLALCAGIFQSGFHPVAGGVLPLVSPPGHDALATSIFIAGGNIGFAVAPVLVALYMEQAGTDALPYLSLLAVIYALLLMVRRLHRNPPKQAGGDGFRLRTLFRQRNFLWFIAVIGLRSWSYCALLIYVPLLLSARGLGSVHGASALLAMLSGTVAGGLITGGLSARWRLKTVIALSFVLALVFEGYFLWDPSLGICSYAALVMCGAAIYGSTPVSIVWSRREMSGHAAGFATSLMLGLTFGLGYIASVLTGALSDLWGIQAGLALTVLPSMLLALVILGFLPEPKPLPVDPAAVTGSKGAEKNA